jgi:EAL domain-containing protein (putative c-di-GMP-specific phosphodiesterase class I)/FixJ family two-component response regulator
MSTSSSLPPANALPGARAPELRAEVPPPHYWRRWSGDAPPARPPATAATPAADARSPQGADEPPGRVLVVEDDPAQALFAEQVLVGAGLQVQIVAQATGLLPAMEAFEPDLVLMDLHLPGASGTELTAAIRAHPAFTHVPVVFLTGDPDPERPYEALELGADDFLSKPIRPRHLVTAVNSRIRRARALARQRFGAESRNPVTGLHTRSFVLQRIASALAEGPEGGALFVEIQGAAALLEHYGYAVFEQLMLAVGLRASELAAPRPCARLNDNAVLVFAGEEDAAALRAFATRLRAGLAAHVFDCAGVPQRLRVAIGYSAFEGNAFADAGAVLEAAEQAARAARRADDGLAAYVAPVASAGDADLAEQLRAALRDGAFELQLQPVVAVAGGEDAQFQVLLRLRTADGGVRSAGELVPVAEAAGLMPEIDRWVLGEAIALLHRRQQEGRPLRLFVSQSPRTLARDLQAAWLLEMLARHGIAGPSLVIDLRLDDALVHAVTVRQFSEQLVPAGVQFCLSQYAHDADADTLLQQLPLGYLRLSGRYAIAHADGALRDELRGIIDRAHRLGLQVIGPQVEDPQGAATLWMSGIDLIQGNLVQAAADAPDFDFQHAVL